jgi:two-component system, NtrC family, sensor histidine kinase HydH
MTSASDGSVTLEAGLRGTTVVKPFSLLRWLSILSFLALVLFAGAVAFYLTRYLTACMLERDAEVSREFIESIVAAEKSKNPSLHGSGLPTELLDYHLLRLPNVIRVNLYSTDRTVLWSSDQRLVGTRFDHNNELERALRGNIVVESGRVDPHDNKPEHTGLTEKVLLSEGGRFVEAYLPIRDESGQNVVGIVEIYKLPRALFNAIDEGVFLVWASVTAGGLSLYLALLSIVLRADMIMRDQRDRLIEAETLMAAGEMAALVAHGIRNPLASIRSAAEIACEEEGEGTKECLQDIIVQADRLAGWVHELLAAWRGFALPTEQVDLNRLVRETLEGVTPELRKRGIELILHEGSLPAVRGSRASLAHAFGNIVNNAIEAMPHGGHLCVESHATRNGSAEIVVEDTGRGMPGRVRRRVFQPLFTTKPEGVGLGLFLTRRILDRHAGRIDLKSIEGRGTRVVLTLPSGG